MRLIDLFQKPDYYPLERGQAFPQYHEDGDKVEWHHPGLWHYRFWHHGVCIMYASHNTFDPSYLMGGEL